jgi:Skp family chaperone for outer membrane proteins
MKMSLPVAAVLAAGVMMAAGAAAWAAQEPLKVPAGTHVAFVSAQRILAESTQGKAQIAKLQALQQQKTGDLRTRQQALDATRQKLAAAADAAERTKLQQEELTERTELEKAAAQAQTDLQAFQRTANADLQVTVKATLDELLQGSDINVVLSADTSVVWARTSVDLTALVIQRMNARAAASAKP